MWRWEVSVRCMRGLTSLSPFWGAEVSFGQVLYQKPLKNPPSLSLNSLNSDAWANFKCRTVEVKTIGMWKSWTNPSNRAPVERSSSNEQMPREIASMVEIWCLRHPSTIWNWKGSARTCRDGRPLNSSSFLMESSWCWCCLMFLLRCGCFKVPA